MFTQTFLARRFCAALMGCCLWMLAYGANAQVVTDRAATDQVAAQLVASVDAVHPGAEIYVGVHQRIIPHWHTYWLNPGDSGNATTIEWTLPPGASVGDIIWPAPGRVSMGPITNYAYENDVTLLSKIQVPVDAKPGEPFLIHALVDWLVCEKECIPQQVELALSLPIVATNAPAGKGSPLIDESLARLPVASPWPIKVSTSEGALTLHIAIPAAQTERVSDIWFYPNDWGRIQQSLEQSRKHIADGIELTLQTGEAPLAAGEALTGVLVINETTSEGKVARGFVVNAVPQVASAVVQDIGLVTALLLALVGGIILNLMPCVFPVLSIKALSLVSHGNQSPAQIRLHGFIYTLGVLASFAVLAILLIVLKAGGAQIGWGFQFQSPLFVLAVAYLMFAVGLSLSGVFFIGGAVAGVGSSLAEKPGYTGSFFTGVLATIVATPCTAPFMAAALGYALAQPAPQLLAIFLSLGLGLALPYLLLTSWPRLQRWLPRPGLWMERAKQLLAFPMYAAAIWLVWVLVQQAGVNAVVIALGGMLLIAFAAWLYDSTRTLGNRGRHLATLVALVSVALAITSGYAGIQANAAIGQPGAVHASNAAGEHIWEPYSAGRLEGLLREGKPVFLNFTASWCISCLVNERVALSDSAVIKTFKESGVTYLKGDWTNRDAEITSILKKFGRSGVPLYVFYPAGNVGEPQELPQILTPDIVISAISPSLSQ